MLITYLKSAPCHQQTEYTLLVTKTYLKISCTLTYHILFTHCVLLSHAKILILFSKHFSSFLYFSLSYFFLLCRNLSVIFLPLWWNTRFFIRKMFIRKWTSKTPKSSEKVKKISSLKCLSCNLKSLIFPRFL